jgi:1-pyrroline-5-carboxylate dehydrogenase
MFRNVTSKEFILNLHGSFPHSYSFSALQKFATVNPFTLSASKPYKIQNRVNGSWKDANDYVKIVDPLNGEEFLDCPNTKTKEELDEFIKSLETCPKSGLHNPLKNVERYLHYGQICQRVASLLYDQEVYEFFVKLVQRVMPKSAVQAKGEVNVVRKFFENFSGDQVRFLCKSTNVSGDHLGQQSSSYRWPYGAVSIICPFNFPIEIPALQLMGALFCGNKVLLKCDSKVSLVIEQFLRMLLFCGLPPTDVDFINCDGPPMESILLNAPVRLTQFTGSSGVANRLAEKLKGKVKLEDAGFDWKILGPDVSNVDYIAWTCDQDAYAISGQKCSAQSILFAHENWVKVGLFDKMKDLAARRKLEDLTCVPVLTWTNERIKEHCKKVLEVPGAKVLFGNKELTGHKIPSIYGAFEPTAIYVPIKELLDPKHFKICTTELFGPFQIVTSYAEGEIDLVLEACERMDHHLTAAVVSNDLLFTQYVLGNTVNGTTYNGIRARTTGAPQNHWFGPAGDPRGAGIGSPEAILSVWSCHREIINDIGPIKKDWTIPDAS